MIAIVPVIMWATTNPITLGIVTTGAVAGIKTAIGIGAGLVIAHAMGF